MLNEAIELAEMGWHILPVGKDKMPLTAHGFKDATTDKNVITDWYNQGLLTNIAVSCAASGMFVLDIDPRNGGYETLNALVEANGNLPYTVSTKTANNGQHYYFRLPEGARLKGRLGLGIDVKSKGYTILPPSTLENNGGYTWIGKPGHIPVAAAPGWLQSLVVKPEVEITQYTPATLPEDARPGDRYNTEESWENILKPLGWQIAHTVDGETFWTRPGKDEGVSASTNYKGTDLLYVFTSSTDLEPDTAYTKFNHLAITQFGGDHSAAARDLAEKYRESERVESGALFHQPSSYVDSRKQLEHTVEMVVPEYTFEPAFDAGHFVGKFIDYCSDQTDAAREYSEAAALVLLSAVTQFNRINLSAFPGGLHTNLYVCLVGQSTKSRKSTIQRIANTTLRNVAPGAALPSKMTPEALINELSHRNGMPSVYSPDEFGIILSQIMDRSFMKGMEEMLLTVYSGDNYSYLKADGTSTDIRQPHLSVLAAATPESLAFAGAKATMSGLIPRFAMVFPKHIPPLRPVGVMPQLDEQGIIQHLIGVRNWAHTPPAELTFTSGSLKILNEAEERLLGQGLSVARLPTMLYKVAALSALSSKRKDVLDSDAESAVGVISRWADGAERLTPILMRNSTDYSFQRAAEEAYDILKRRGGISHRSFIAAEMKTTESRMTQIQKALEDWRYIIVDKPNGNWVDRSTHGSGTD